MKEEVIVGLLEHNGPEQLESIALRDKVLRKPIGLKFSEVDLISEKTEHHIGAMLEGDVVGILLLRHLNDDEVKMRQVAVDFDLQGKGIGKKMVDFSEDLARSLGYKLMSLHARDIAIPFYEALNYSKVGEAFTEVGITHYRMEKAL